MLNVRLAGDREIAVHLAVAGDVFDCVFLCCPFSHEMSSMSLVVNPNTEILEQKKPTS